MIGIAGSRKEEFGSRGKVIGAAHRRDWYGVGEADAICANATIPELGSLIYTMDGERTHGVRAISTSYGGVIGRTPPYRPEAQPMEYIWSMVKGWYGTRYEAVGVMGFARRSPGDLIAGYLADIVDRCDIAAACMIDGVRRIS